MIAAALGLALAAWSLVPAPGIARLGVGARRRVASVGSHRWPRRWRLAAAVAAAGAPWVLLPDAWLAAPVAAGIAWGVTGRLPWPDDTSTRAAALPETLELLASCLEAGAPVASAVRTVAEVAAPSTAEGLLRVRTHLDVGLPPERAWAELRSDPAWREVATELVRSSRSGTGLVEGLRAHAEDARDAARDAAIRHARTAGVRSVLPLVLCFLPAFVLVGVVPIIAGLLGDMLG